MRNRHVGGAARVRSCHLTIRSSRDRFAVSRVIHSPAAVRLNSGVRPLQAFMQNTLKLSDYLHDRPAPKGIDVRCKLQHFAIITYAFDPARLAGVMPDRFRL